VIGSSLLIPPTKADGVDEDGENGDGDEDDEDGKDDEDDEDDEDGPTGHATMCCRSKPTGEQRQATRGAERLPGLLVGPGPSVNGPRSGTRPGFWIARRAT
jgi:hypothetical protein